MMKQVLFPPSDSNITNTNSTTLSVQQSQKLEFHKNMTIKGKKNSKVKIIKNKTKHNYWSNIFRRKRIMSEYFSDAAFGSQSDTKKELFNPWEDPELLKKLRAKLIMLQYEYDPADEVEEEQQRPNPKISFMNDPNNFNIKPKDKKSE